MNDANVKFYCHVRMEMTNLLKYRLPNVLQMLQFNTSYLSKQMRTVINCWVYKIVLYARLILLTNKRLRLCLQ